MFRRAISLRALLTLLCLVPLAAGCDRAPQWLDVERVEPVSRDGTPPLVALNQTVTVYFTDAIDPLSVTSESVRVADQSGRSVDGYIEIGTRSVRFRPRTPLTPGLDDGSFRPGEAYRLEVAGMPSSFALRSRAGRPLRRPIGFRLIAARDPGQLGLPTLFLPAGIGDEEFQVDLQSNAGLRLAADSRRLSFRLNMPPLPGSARPEAFRMWRIVTGANVPQQVPIVAVTVRCPDEGRVGGSSVAQLTLELARDSTLEGGDLLFLEFAEGEGGLVDFRGRPLRLPAALPVKVDPGERVRARDVDLAQLVFEPHEDAALTFERREGRIQPRARVEAGTAHSGTLRIGAGTHLRIAEGEDFECPPGVPRSASGNDLEFASIVVDPGAELELAPGAAALVLRVTREVRIRGRLTLSHSAREVPWRAGRSPGVDELARASGVCLVIGGDLIVEPGAEIVVTGEKTGSPLTLVVGGTPIVEGRVPPQITLALPAQVRVQGVLEAPIVLPSEMTPGLPPGTTLRAGASTQWMPLPSDHSEAIDVELEDLRGALRVYLEVAPPDIVRPDRPRTDTDHILAPLRLPLREPLRVPAGAYFRLLLEADLGGGEPPSVAGFAIHAR